VAIGDTSGSRKGNSSALPGTGGAAVYVLDPPLGSTRGSNPAKNSYYEGGGDEPGPDYATRSFPAERNKGNANFLFADGHADAKTMAEIDDLDSDGTKDNGYWNGRGDANPATTRN